MFSWRRDSRESRRITKALALSNDVQNSVEWRLIGQTAVCTLANPPVNGLSHAVRARLHGLLGEFQRDTAIHVIILRGGGRGFSSGGDLRELGTEAAAAWPRLSADVHQSIERSHKPVIAALHGFAIGGGFETALACHYRVVRADTRLGLPEVQLGILPLSGTQRCPRVLALTMTLEMIIEGRRFEAAELRDTAVFDRIVDDPRTDLLSETLAFADDVLKRNTHPLIRDRPLVTSAAAELLAGLRTQYAKAVPAVKAAIEAIAAAYECADFDAGLARAQALYDALTPRTGRSEKCA